MDLLPEISSRSKDVYIDRMERAAVLDLNYSLSSWPVQATDSAIALTSHECGRLGKIASQKTNVPVC
jgi:hypothetical protein